MPRVIRVKSARKYQGPCSKCGTPINAGSSYVHFQLYRQPKVKRCANPDCYPKASELTGSEFLSQLYDLQDRLQDVTSYDEVQELASEIRDLGAEQQEKVYNMPEGLQEGDTGQMLQDRADACETWADELEDVDEDEDEYLDQVRNIEYPGE